MATDQRTRVTLHFKQGETFRMRATARFANSQPVVWADVSEVRMQCRQGDAANPTPVISLSSNETGGGITLVDGGLIYVLVDAEKTAALEAYSYGVWDLEIEFPAADGELVPDVRRPLEGDYDVDAEVTR